MGPGSGRKQDSISHGQGNTASCHGKSRFGPVTAGRRNFPRSNLKVKMLRSILNLALYPVQVSVTKSPNAGTYDFTKKIYSQIWQYAFNSLCLGIGITLAIPPALLLIFQRGSKAFSKFDDVFSFLSKIPFVSSFVIVVSPYFLRDTFRYH